MTVISDMRHVFRDYRKIAPDQHLQVALLRPKEESGIYNGYRSI